MLKHGAQVKCIKGSGTALVHGRTYTIERETIEAGHNYYYIDGGGWDIDRFIIMACPCSISGCIKHRKHRTKLT